MANITQLLEGASQCTHPFFGGPDLLSVCSRSNSSATFLSLFNLLLTLNPKTGDPCGQVNPIMMPNLSYDFIVVGGGAAGPPAAYRLSESPNVSVLLIEAGPEPPAATEVPSNLQLYLNTELDWRYYTSNESHACIRNGGSCSWPRGKNLGGCTSHHGMAYHRGHKLDYTRWVEMGNKGWSFEEVLPYFLRAEDNKEIERVGRKYHGVGGRLNVERFPWRPYLAKTVLEAAEETGLGVTEDIVGDQITGFTVAQTISKDGVRQASQAAYLQPVRNRRNLHVMVNATVTKIMMSGKTVTGVRFLRNGKESFVRAKKEVIVSGGAINSPQLLLLSGIGPRKHLQSVGIRTTHDLPGVGSNLHNHVSYGLDYELNTTKEELFTPANAELYLYNQTGPMSSTGMAQLTGILASKYTTPDDPDIQIFFAGFQATCPTNGRIEDLASVSDKEAVRFTSVNLQSLSRGCVSLINNNPLSHPKIWSNELSHPQDVEIILEGIRFIQKLVNSSAMQQYAPAHLRKAEPACDQLEYDSDDYWRCMIKWDTRPENHQAGSCKMGPRSDPMAVVDPRLRVHGIKGLRVADASVMPKVISGNPVATVDMIGWRVADFIAEDHRIKLT